MTTSRTTNRTCTWTLMYALPVQCRGCQGHGRTDVLQPEAGLRVGRDDQRDLSVRHRDVRQRDNEAIVEDGSGIQRRASISRVRSRRIVAVGALIRYSRADVKFDDPDHRSADGQGGWRRSGRRRPCQILTACGPTPLTPGTRSDTLPVRPKRKRADAPASTSFGIRRQIAGRTRADECHFVLLICGFC